MRNQWSRFASYRQQWASSSSGGGRSHATSKSMRISPKGYCPSYFDYCMVIDEMLPQKVKPVVHSFDFLIFWRMMVTMEMVVEPQSSRFGQFLALIIPNIVIHDICFFAVIPRKLGRRTCGDVQISTICEGWKNAGVVCLKKSIALSQLMRLFRLISDNLACRGEHRHAQLQSTLLENFRSPQPLECMTLSDQSVGL
ncbi:hypothetical protein SAY87_008303 [Trapa incisa]|uniref:Uncharacterized protein n=1 Tax=Trapa incisa TaxID=236973 RepID=A0AAN7KGH5_9MYRT|nr:hypothetical protein SAY87_008303 [Trapa incisa]